MILFTNGCSWTWGGSINVEGDSLGDHLYAEQKRQKLLWPHHLGVKLNTKKTVNLSMGCGSNERIARTTFDWLQTQTIEDLKEAVAVIQITNINRYEYYYPTDLSSWTENNLNDWRLAKIDHVLPQISKAGRMASNLEKKIHEGRMSTWSKTEEAYKCIYQLAAIDKILNDFGVKKRYYWTFIEDIRYYPSHIKEYIKKIYPNFIDTPWDLNTYWQYDRINSTDTHPSIEGHKQIADIIYNIIKSDINE